MRIALVGLGGVRAEFAHWPERVIGADLVRRGVEVVAFVQGPPRTEGVEGVRVRALPPRTGPNRALRRALAAEGPFDLIHLFHPRNLHAWEAVRYARRTGTPVVFTWLGPFHDEFLIANREAPYEETPRYEGLIFTPGRLLARLLTDPLHPRRHLRNYAVHAPLRAADLWISPSAHEREVLIRMGIDPARIHVLPLWLNRAFLEGLVPEPVDLAAPRPWILYVGQLTPRKGADWLIRALPRILARIPSASLLIAGHNPARRSELIALAEALGVRDRLHLLGFVSEAQKAFLFRECDVYVLPTRYEGFGLPLLEAYWFETPLVSTRIPVVDEVVVDGETGVLVPYGDVDALADAVAGLLADPDRARRLGAAGRRRLEAVYDGRRLVERLLQLYGTVWGTMPGVDR